MKTFWSLTIAVVIVMMISASMAGAEFVIPDCDGDTEKCSDSPASAPEQKTAAQAPPPAAPAPAVPAAPVATEPSNDVLAAIANKIVGALEEKLAETRNGLEKGLTELKGKNEATDKVAKNAEKKVVALEGSVKAAVNTASSWAKAAAKSAKEATETAEEANGFAKAASDTAVIVNSSAERAEKSAKVAAESAASAARDAGRAKETADEVRKWVIIALAALAVMVVGVGIFLFATRKKKQPPVNQRHADKARATAEKDTDKMLLEGEIKRIEDSISQNELTLKGLTPGTEDHTSIQNAIWMLKGRLSEVNAKHAKLYP